MIILGNGIGINKIIIIGSIDMCRKVGMIEVKTGINNANFDG